MGKSGPIIVLLFLSGILLTSFIYVSLLYSNKEHKGSILGSVLTWKTIETLHKHFHLERSKLPFACLFAYTLLIVLSGLLQNLVRAAKEGLDNSSPRTGRAEAKGLLSRVYGLHSNTLENFAIFAVGVFMAHLAKVDIEVQISFSVLFVLFRLIYSICYLFDASHFRTFFFFCSLWAAWFLMLNGMYGKEFDQWHLKTIRHLIDMVKGFATTGRIEL